MIRSVAYGVLLGLCAVSLAAQEDSALPPDIQATVDRIRHEMRLPGVTPAPPPAQPAARPAPLNTPEELEADAIDNEILMRTMHSVSVDDLESSATLRDSTELDAREMLDAAQRLADRGDQRVQRLIAGSFPAEAIAAARAEAANRRHTLDLVNDRVAMLSELIEMARADEDGPSGARRIGFGAFRYDGSGRLIRPAELATMSAAFQRKFFKPLPISAWGETETHQLLGFDHHGRVDVAVGPDGAEGRWIRAWLEHARIPYYAFRTALLGSSTGPHIHIGPGSTRTRAFTRRNVRRQRG